MLGLIVLLSVVTFSHHNKIVERSWVFPGANNNLNQNINTYAAHNDNKLSNNISHKENKTPGSGGKIIFPGNSGVEYNGVVYQKNKNKKGGKNSQKGKNNKKKPRRTKCRCGIPRRFKSRESGMEQRIIGGEETSLREFPWLVAIHRDEDNKNNNRVDCTGSLISDRWIITAAHCIPWWKDNPEKEIYVRINEHDVSSGNETAEHVRTIITQPKQIIIHPEYHHYTHVNDIALIYLPFRLRWSVDGPPICLPRKRDRRRAATAAGWGAVDSQGFEFPDVPYKVNMNIQSDAYCNATIPTKLEPTQMCAGGQERKDTCTGDSGGPLMTRQRRRRKNYILTGITSYAIGYTCGRKDNPAVYTNVFKYVGWIRKETRNGRMCLR